MANAQFRMLDLSIETKRNLPLVTEAGRASEGALRERVAAARPDERVRARFRRFGACALSLKAPKGLYTHRIVEILQTFSTEKRRFAALLQSPLTDSNRGPLLTMGPPRQAVATHCNRFRLFRPLSRPSDLRPVASGCDRPAP
jgi:hypothetical protein